MQELNRTTASPHAITRKSCWPYVALGLALAVYQPGQADSTISAPQAEAKAPKSIWATLTTSGLSTSQHCAEPAIPYLSASATDSTNSAQILEEEDDAHRPGDSYNQANLRVQYETCAAASGGVTPAIKACMDEEFHWQQARLRNAWGTIADGPDSEYKDKLADEQDAYMRDTDRHCHFDVATQGQGQMLDALSCRINRYANRADALETLINN